MLAVSQFEIETGKDIVFTIVKNTGKHLCIKK